MSDNKKGKKRPKSYYIKCAAGGKKFKHANDLAAGMKGFLVTCNKYEKETVREMYNILNEYADEMYGPEVKEVKEDDSGSEEEDMEKAMAKETSAMKETAGKERRFQNTDTKAKNCIFIRTTVDSPTDLAHRIFTDLVNTQVQKARYALRMLPISITCKTNMPNITEAAETILKPHFETDFGVGLKYTSVCKIRNNNSVSRTAILPAIGKIVHELNPLHRLCHDEPDLVVIVEVIRNVCCMSVVKDYFLFRKYNFHEVLKKPETVDEVVIRKDTAENRVEDKEKLPDKHKGQDMEENFSLKQGKVEVTEGKEETKSTVEVNEAKSLAEVEIMVEENKETMDKGKTNSVVNEESKSIEAAEVMEDGKGEAVLQTEVEERDALKPTDNENVEGVECSPDISLAKCGEETSDNLKEISKIKKDSESRDVEGSKPECQVENKGELDQPVIVVETENDNSVVDKPEDSKTSDVIVIN